ncbi:hypothetical protein [Nonomuraea sp. NPDC049684]|uniref:hypothetical protein n=1 Tax=unclassified Nonomuraea TaxID=2593643 RepID=UPI0037A55236
MSWRSGGGRLAARPARRVAARQAELAAADAMLGVDGPFDRARQSMLRVLVEDADWDDAAAAWRDLGQPYEPGAEPVPRRAGRSGGGRPTRQNGPAERPGSGKPRGRPVSRAPRAR